MGGRYIPMACPESHEEFMGYVCNFFPEVGKLIKFDIFGVKPSKFNELVKIVRYPYNTKTSSLFVDDHTLHLIKTWMLVNKHMYVYWVL